jgi:FAD/FMN-containing dehydrogenase
MMAATVSVLPEISEEELTEFRMMLGGEALRPGDPGYDQVRPSFSAMYTDRPGLVVLCKGTADVVAAVDFARARGIEVTVRGGGHSVAGLSSTDGGMVIDLGPMNGVLVDKDAQLAYVQGGALWADVDREAQLYGLSTPGGVVSDTGVAGLTLGGGYGWLRRTYGLSCDNVAAYEVVTADGRVLEASANENQDLYWALRGGGGNFGIVTRFTFRLHPVGPIVPFAGVFYPSADAETVLRGFREYAERAPDTVNCMAVAIGPFPEDPHLPPEVHGQKCIVVAAVFVGDVEDGMAEIQPLRELGTPLADISQPMPFRMVQSAFDAFFQRQEVRTYWKSTSADVLSDGLIDVIATGAEERPAPLATIVLWLTGGKVNAVGQDEAAFSERSAKYLLSVEGTWHDPADDDKVVPWVRDTWGKIAEFGTGTTYINFAEEGEGVVDEAFGTKLEKLAQIKAKYDPENFFRRNNNIAPAA